MLEISSSINSVVRKFKKTLKIFGREIRWILPRVFTLIVGSLFLYVLSVSGYLVDPIYSLASRAWLVAYIFFGVALFMRYLLSSVRKLIYNLGTRYIVEASDRLKLRQSVYTYGRIVEYGVYLVALLASLNLFINIQAVWTALGTTLFLIITFFIGLMTSSVLGNVLAFEVLRQTESVSVGDRIKLRGDIYGDVVSKGAFFVKVRTIKNELMSIPNLYLVNNMVTNYSKEKPVILHVPVSLGYEVPREVAKRLLIDAAKRTKGILKNPDPFVLFLKLGNYSITYEVNAYIDKPEWLIDIKSRLIENILETFEKNHIEIESPSITIFRTKHTSKKALEQLKGNTRR